MGFDSVGMLQGRLADRDSWSAVGHCPIERTMAFAGTKSAMLIMREAFYGTTRFDDFARRVGITKAATSARLSDLVAAGLLAETALSRARSAGARRVRAHRIRNRFHAGGVGHVRVGSRASQRHRAAGSRMTGVVRWPESKSVVRKDTRCRPTNSSYRVERGTS